MSDDLNARAARAMGWKAQKARPKGYEHDYWLLFDGRGNDGETFDSAGYPQINCEHYTEEKAIARFAPQYTTDANAKDELLQEVKRRGLMGAFIDAIYETGHEQFSGTNFIEWLLTAPLETIVKAAVEVLEAE